MSKCAPSRGELAHAVGAFGHEDAHRVDVAQPRARGQRVGEVQIGRVGRGERGRDAALRVARRRMRQLALGQHEHRQASPRRVERSRQPRDATPQHEDVVHERQPRWRVGWSRIQTRFEPARCTASLLVDRPVRLVDVHDRRRVRRELGLVVDART